MEELCIERHLVDLSLVGEPLVTYAKKYTRRLQVPSAQQGVSSAKPKETCVLVMAHALAYHKETWEVVISHLFEQGVTQEQDVDIGEIWAIDEADHGESASLNKSAPQSVLRSGRVSCRSYGAAIVALVRSGLLSASSHSRLVLVGHSAGAIGAVLSTTFPSSPKDIPASSIILVEPWMPHPDAVSADPRLRAIVDGLSQSGYRRRDVWASREEARSYFGAKGVWKSWNARVLDLYVEYGLRPVSSTKNDGVTLAYPKHLEGNAYADLGESVDALEQLSKLCSGVPVHVVFGEEQLKIPAVPAVQANLCDPEQGRRMASTTVLPQVGHTAPQQNPALVSKALWKIIDQGLCTQQSALEKL